MRRVTDRNSGRRRPCHDPPGGYSDIEANPAEHAGVAVRRVSAVRLEYARHSLLRSDDQADCWCESACQDADLDSLWSLSGRRGNQRSNQRGRRQRRTMIKHVMPLAAHPAH